MTTTTTTTTITDDDDDDHHHDHDDDEDERRYQQNKTFLTTLKGISIINSHCDAKQFKAKSWFQQILA